jgi:hypothetical protein
VAQHCIRLAQDDLRLNSDRVITMKIKFREGDDIIICGIYAPNEGPEREQLFQAVRDSLMENDI